MKLLAYKRTITHTESPRQIERRLLVSVTAQLERDYLPYDQSERRIERLQFLADGLRTPLWKNQQVWSAFKLDLAEAKNGLEPALRASMLSIAIWVEKHTQGVMAGGKQIRPLIDINHSIINGLSDGLMTEAAE